MRTNLVYDLPTRIFHWLFAILFIVAFGIGTYVSDESASFPLHMLAGATMAFLVLVRIVWGFIGTQHARFSGFALNPLDLISYLKGILTGDKKRWAGHNPASSWAALIMMIIALALASTGILMVTGYKKHIVKEIHELLANGFLIVVIMHIAGVILHSVRHRDNIALSMVDGNKADIAENEIIPDSKKWLGIMLLVMVFAFIGNLFGNYNSPTRTVNIFGKYVRLGESEEHQKVRKERKHQKKLEKALADKQIEIDGAITAIDNSGDSGASGASGSH
ncbi:MAG: cytochrome b/b6 domain-containing protein [bacterium]|nr:cytochrome b/b6 domain-containing protein [bacterium]